jgi:S1-C subfamily serine protease
MSEAYQPPAPGDRPADETAGHLPPPPGPGTPGQYPASGPYPGSGPYQGSAPYSWGPDADTDPGRSPWSAPYQDGNWQPTRPLYQPGDPAGPAQPWAWPPPGGAWGPAGATPPSPPRRRLPVLLLFGSVLIIAALVAGLLVGRSVWRPTSTPATDAAAGGGRALPAATDPATSTPGGASTAGPANASAIAAAVDPGLVDVVTTLGFQGGQAAGTGMVLTADGLVLTNNHVIEGATAISVTDVGDGRTYDASVVGYDRSDDVAVIQLADASGLATVSTGNSSGVKVGDAILAIGNAGGSGGTPSVAPGTVTALNQSITASDGSGGGSEQLTGLIQLNADLQPGDSGGPLVDGSAKVIGMDTAASSGFQFQNSASEGFAIPINQALSIAGQIRAGQSSATVHIGQSAFLGVEVSSPVNRGGRTGSGATVAGVVPDSPADQAGLSEGDVITSLGGHSIDSGSTLTDLMTTHHPDDQVTLGWTDRAGQAHSAAVRLATGPAY